MKIALPWKDESGLFKHGSMMVVGTFVGALCNAGFHMVVGRTLSGPEYGSLVAMLGIILVVSTPMLSLQNTLAHFTSRLVKEEKRDEIMTLFLHWVELFLVLSAGLVAVGFFFRMPLAAFWGGVDPRLIVATFSVLAISLWMNIFYGLLQGMQSFTWLAWAPQAWGGTRLLLGGLLTATVSATALAAMGAQGVGVLMVLALCFKAVRTLQLPPRRKRVSPHETYGYLGSSLVCLAGFAMLMNLDTTLAKHYFDADTVGLFAKAAIIARTAVFLPVPIAMALFPKVTSTGTLSDESWGLLLRAVAFAGLIIVGVVGVCLVLPQLPWTILYGPCPAATVDTAVQLTRAMVLAMSPLAFAYLLLNFEMAQQRFLWCYSMVPCGIAYVVGVMLFHERPIQIAYVVGGINLAAALLLLTGILLQRRRRPA
jgi:O-antigen/teichoic acid export membrane protein